MEPLLTTLDIYIFAGSLLAIMGLGLWAGWKEEDSDDYFLAGHNSRWWGVAGSIFGSNVSANHIIGMMGVGFAAGFAMSHFEITAIAGLLLLCYGFLPVYRKLNLFTLSDYLGRRYGESSRILYAVIMLLVIVVIQMVPGFYIGSRYLNALLQAGETATAEAVVGSDGKITRIDFQHGVGYGTPPAVIIDLPPSKSGADLGKATASIAKYVAVRGEDGELEAILADEFAGANEDVEQTFMGIDAIQIDDSGDGYDSEYPPNVTLKGGASFDPTLEPGDIDPRWYKAGILLMALVTGTYVIFGGLKAVIVTDVLQSILMLCAALFVGIVIFSQPEIGGWWGMLAHDDVQNGGKGLMRLYRPTNHGGFPWTGTLSGLMVLHFYYWGTNQFIVQRALSARSDREARTGIIAAGFFKLLIPFMSIGGGIAAFYYFSEKKLLDTVDQDAAFMEVMRHMIVDFEINGFVIRGVVGLVAAGVVGAILSSVDSMLNSGSTIITFDVYKRYLNPGASERRLVWMGRLWVVLFIVAAATLTIFTMDPNGEGSFFMQIANHQSKLVAGVVVAFALGMFWKRSTSAGATVAIVVGVAASYMLPVLYSGNLDDDGPKLMRGYTGTKLIVETDRQFVRFFEKTTRGIDGEMVENEPKWYQQHHFRDGDVVRFTAAKELPAANEVISTDVSYFVRAVDAFELTLHHSRSDAESNRDPLIFVTQGQGKQKLYLYSAHQTVSWWGSHLNFMHSVFLAAVLAFILHVLVSLATPRPEEAQSALTWTGLGGHDPSVLTKAAAKVAISVALFAVLAWLMVAGMFAPLVAGLIAAAWTFLMFLDAAIASVIASSAAAAAVKWIGEGQRPPAEEPSPRAVSLLEEDRFWAGLLAALAVFMMFYFY